MTTNKIIILAGASESTNILYHKLAEEFKIDNVIIESPISMSKFLKNRIKKLGYIEVFGQILFMILIVPLLKIKSRKRMGQIIKNNHFNLGKISAKKITHVNSINSNKTKQLIKDLNPDIIIVNGTRIISQKIINATKAIMINTHAGITPQYRGVHGGYWAIRNEDIENCGVTVHLIDEGIDTGGVIYQSTIRSSNEDNFITYPFLQLSEGIKLLKKTIYDIQDNKLKLKSRQNCLSNLWYHPTAFGYIYHRLTKGIK